MGQCDWGHQADHSPSNPTDASSHIVETGNENLRFK